MNSTPNLLLQHPTHLWISDQKTLATNICTELKKIICIKKHTNNSCSTCNQIDTHQHPWVIWLHPENSYKLEDIDQVIETVQFKLDSNEKRFFIFSHAHELTVACSNRLLKTIEEPHQNYFFIFLASRTDTILPTIRSRCFIKEFTEQNLEPEFQEIMAPFLSDNFDKPVDFIKLIDKFDIKEIQTKYIVDQLIAAFHKKLKQHIQSQQEEQATYMLHKLSVLQENLDKLPAQGSSKLFWKNIFLNFNTIHINRF